VALPNPTIAAITNVTLTLNDLLTTGNTQTLNRIITPLVFNASDVQYQGYINIPPLGTFTATPVGLTVAFGVVYVRNLGTGPVGVSLTPVGGAANVYGLDVGALILYAASKPLSSIAVTGGSTPGITVVTVSTTATSTANVELLVAG
jgi:hypothetical protein